MLLVSGLAVSSACSHGTAETFFTAEELVLAEFAHRGVGVAEGVHLREELREAGRVRLTNLLESVPVESCSRERLARLPDGREGIDRPSGLGEPANELDRVELQVPRGLVSVRKALSDEDGRTRDGGRGGSPVRRPEVWDVVNDQGEPGGICRLIWQR